MYYDQAGYAVRLEWGEGGVRALAPISEVVVIVDVLSFSTAVDIATGRGAVVLPYSGPGDAAAGFAARNEAILAGGPGGHGGSSRYTLSPSSLLAIGRGERLLLPSLNGSTLTALAVELSSSEGVLAGCLRNATAVARVAAGLGRHVAVIAAGERWPHDRTLRPAVEDLVGAGAIIARLPGTCSPEAELAVAAYRAAEGRLAELLRRCGSGRELLDRGKAADVALAAQLDASEHAPQLIAGAFQAVPVS